VKWVLLIVAAALVWPISFRLRRNSRERLAVFALIGFLPFIVEYEHLYMALDSWVWDGYVKGAEVSFLDLLVLSVNLSLPRGDDRFPFRLPVALYFGATAMTVIEAAVPMAALFYCLQLVRVILLSVTVYRGICADPRVAQAVFKGMGGGILLEAAFTVWQRFGLGILQASGTFESQNQLGLTSHFTVIPFFALVLCARRGWLPPMVVAAGLIVEVLTTSRGTLLFGSFGLVTVFVLSVLRQWTSRKSRILLGAVAAAAVFAPIAASSLQQRFSGQAATEFVEDNERVTYKEAAAMMLSDHPMGVGANHFNYIANVGGYFDRVGDFWWAGRGSNVHNVYWLVASETGYVGLLTFVFLLLRPLTVAFACAFRHRRDVRGDLQLGLGVALLAVYFHSFEEWIFVTFPAQYLFALDIGLIAGLARELAKERGASS
jgi:O-antigen ligase